MENRLVKIFFAIPCADSFSIQTRIIREVCKSFGIMAVIVEDHSQTDILWRKITDKIDDADYFIADISSDSKNTILELGYAMREKKLRNIGIFIANTISVPSDLRGQTLQIYSGFKSLKSNLIRWIKDNVLYSHEPSSLDSLDKFLKTIEEDFRNKEKFLRLWSNPPFSSFNFTSEGLRFTNSDFPIMTNYLGLLQNYEFIFRAKLIRNAFGWVVKGSKSFPNILPEFCVMFNITEANKLTSHIYNINNKSNYSWQRIEEIQCNDLIRKNEWFEITTKVEGDRITIIKENKKLFEKDFNEAPYKEFYTYDNKQGEVGFRCHPGEEGLVDYIKVREIS